MPLTTAVRVTLSSQGEAVYRDSWPCSFRAVTSSFLSGRKDSRGVQDDSHLLVQVKGDGRWSAKMVANHPFNSTHTCAHYSLQQEEDPISSALMTCFGQQNAAEWHFVNYRPRP